MNEFGTLYYEGKKYDILQAPYLNVQNDKIRYVATAQDEEGKKYEITWKLTDFAAEKFKDIEDESEMCDWNYPIEVKPICHL